MILASLSELVREESVVSRFTTKVDKRGPDECWPWTAAINSAGYGVIGIRGDGGAWSTRKAHRFAYELWAGPIPEGLTLDHLCRNPRCVNPAHLEPVTQGVNVLRSDAPTALNAAKTHCPQGHPYDEANTRIETSSGLRSRRCRMCRAAAWTPAAAAKQRAKRARKRQERAS